MASTVQIVPKFSFPYVETTINDYTHLSDEVSSVNGLGDDTVRFVFAFVGSKGIDNVWVKKTTEKDFVNTFGTSNYKKYKQPIMMPLNLLSAGNCECWCMRVMPENAAYAHVIASLYYKADGEDVAVADRKFRMKIVTKYSETPLTTVEDIKTLLATEDTGLTGGVDADGYTWSPLMAVYSNGRGKYGNNYRIRITQNTTYEKEYGINCNSYEILSTEKGLVKVANYVGGSATSAKYSQATLINDVLADTETGVAPVMVYVDEDALAEVHEAYLDFCSQLHSDAIDALATAAEEDKAKIQEIIDDAAKPVDVDEFDFLRGMKNGSAIEKVPFVVFPTSVTADELAALGDDVNTADYTTTVTSDFSSVYGVKLQKGSDGYFETPRSVEVTDEESGEVTTEQWTYDDEVEDAYNKAYGGELDARILTSKRIQASALFDANYPMSVKQTMAELCLLRDDAMLYLDTGIIESFNTLSLQNMIEEYSVFDNRLISKNCHHYMISEPGTNKRVNVTITYFLAQKYAEHIHRYGCHIPFVKSEAQLSGHIKDSLRPTVEDYETELKETLYKNHFNYFETVDDNVFQRATQSTSQSSESDLTEESNVTTLYTMKRILERHINDSLYDFSDLEVRRSFREYEKAVFADWVGSKIESFDIDFEMNEFEAERSILHCYLSVVFRGIYKRAICEIDINKRDVTTYNTETNSAFLL